MQNKRRDLLLIARERAASALCTLLLAPLLISSAVGAALAHDYRVGKIEIHHPWSRATAEGAKVAAGYVVITNNGPDADRLVAASAEIAGKAEFHEMAVDADGVMTMRPVTAAIDIPAGGKATFEPGSFHIMFMDIKRQLKQGERFAATLTFEHAGPIEVEFAVDAMAGHAGHHMSGG